MTSFSSLQRIGAQQGGTEPPMSAKAPTLLLQNTTPDPTPAIVGIVGANGGGESVLLRILSRITDPTCGSAWVRGRAGCLLEVGTGFHPELCGRENVFLAGAILGMTRREIERRFDEIVEFSGTREFLDEPVKHYSTGMTVRLAFSVAAHLEADVLFLDEVWATGDREFRDRCARKMRELVSNGRTALLVSHDLAELRGLCKRSLLLERGELVLDGPTDDVARRYASGSGSEVPSIHPVRA